MISSLFVVFIFASVIIGAGALLAPAWPSKDPRIGLSAALALGLIVGGGVFNAMLFGWSTLTIDYLLFTLVTGIFLAGTLVIGERRAEENDGQAQDWPGGRDLLFFVFVLLVFLIPALVLPVPLDTDAQGFGYLALMTRLSGSFKTLAPFNPDVTYLYAPGFTMLTAYLSQQLEQTMNVIQMSVGAVLGLMFVWLAYDFGSELRDKRLGRAMALAALGGVGLFTAYMDSHFTTLLALVFAFAFITYTLRYLREQHDADALAAVLMLGNVVLAHPDTTIILTLGYAPWLLTMWLTQPRPTLRTWAVLALGIPALTLLALIPWLLNIRDLLGGDIISPFARSGSHWRVMTLWPHQGIWMVALALVGLVVAWRRQRQVALLTGVWLLLILDFSTTGLLARLFSWLPIFRYDYPFSIAWHGPIIPYTILGGMGLLWLWDKFLAGRFGAALHRWAYVVIGAALVIIAGAGLFSSDLLAASKGHVSFFGAFASSADVRAMTWLRENTSPDARVLNFPGPQEGDWVPVIAERDSVYYRPQPFFRGNAADLAEQDRLRAFWENPADTANAALLTAAGINYVIVPQVVGNPASFETMFRWQRPFSDALTMRSQVADATYLELVFDADGAQVFSMLSQSRTE